MTKKAILKKITKREPSQDGVDLYIELEGEDRTIVYGLGGTVWEGMKGEKNFVVQRLDFTLHLTEDDVKRIDGLIL